MLRAIVLGLPDFETGTSNARFVQSTCSHLASVISLRRAPVSSSSMMACAAARFSSSAMDAIRRLRFLRGQESLPLISQALCRDQLVGLPPAPGHVPFTGQIEDAAEQHQDAISGPSGITAWPACR